MREVAASGVTSYRRLKKRSVFRADRGVWHRARTGLQRTVKLYFIADVIVEWLTHTSHHGMDGVEEDPSKVAITACLSNAHNVFEHIGSSIYTL